MTPPRDLADAQARLDQIRDYAQHLHRMADEYRALDTEAGRYTAHAYAEIARALERKIGGEQ